jgi:hypothetical protein
LVAYITQHHATSRLEREPGPRRQTEVGPVGLEPTINAV